MMIALVLVDLRLSDLRSPAIRRDHEGEKASPEREEMIAVIVVSWNTRELLEACLSSLIASQGAADLDILVVDNASTDGSLTSIAERFPSVRVIANPDNRGFAAATNQGIAATSAPIVLLLNSDTEVAPDAIAALVVALDADPGLGAVGARLVNPDGAFEDSCSRAPTAWREAVHLMHLECFFEGLRYSGERWKTDKSVLVDVIQGACLMVRREVIDVVGGLDEDYFMYSEETEWCERMRTAGWRLAWVPSATVVHHGGGSTRLVPSEMFAQLYASKVRFLRRNRGTGAARAFKAALAIAGAARLIAAPLALLLRPRDTGLRRLTADYSRLLARLPSL